MKTSVFDFAGYKEYLRHWIKNRPHKGRGEKSRLAEALHCQLAYVSQVLNDSAHFSFEQAEAINAFLDHTDDEAEFFILLVHLERAGTPALEKRIHKKIQKILNQRLLLKNRIKYEDALSREDQAVYYSSWQYAAIHMALAIPALRTRDALSQAMRLPVFQVSRVLEFLQARGLVKEVQGVYRIGDARIHLENDSPMISKHHINWRMQAIQSLERDSPLDLHYSSVISVAEKDLPKVRESLVKAIEQVREVVKPSSDEILCCYSLDLFRVATEKS